MLDISPHSSEDSQQKSTQSTGSDPKGQSQSGYDDNNSSVLGKVAKQNTLMDESENLDFMQDKEEGAKALFYVSLVGVLIVIGFWIYVYFNISSQKSLLAKYETEFTELQARLRQPDLAKIEELSTRYTGGLQTLNSLILNQVLYTKFFDELEKSIPTDVVVQNLNIDEKNTFSISANSSSYEQAAIFIKSMQENKNFTTIIFDNIAQNQAQETTNYSIFISGSYNPVKDLSDQMIENDLDTISLDEVSSDGFNNEEGI